VDGIPGDGLGLAAGSADCTTPAMERKSSLEVMVLALVPVQ
jgi:hypothetical protein